LGEATDFGYLWDVSIREEMRLEQVSTSYKNDDDVPNLALIRKMRRGGRKGGRGRAKGTRR
jgi:hypothetical protein